MKWTHRAVAAVCCFLVLGILAILVNSIVNSWNYDVWYAAQPTVVYQVKIINQQNRYVEQQDLSKKINCRPMSAFQKNNPENQVCDHPLVKHYYLHLTVLTGDLQTQVFDTGFYGEDESQLPTFKVNSCFLFTVKAHSLLFVKPTTCP